MSLQLHMHGATVHLAVRQTTYVLCWHVWPLWPARPALEALAWCLFVNAASRAPSRFGLPVVVQDGMVEPGCCCVGEVLVTLQQWGASLQWQAKAVHQERRAASLEAILRLARLPKQG